MDELARFRKGWTARRRRRIFLRRALRFILVTLFALLVLAMFGLEHSWR